MPEYTADKQTNNEIKNNNEKRFHIGIGHILCKIIRYALYICII